ncbi:MAG TPA: HEAT repeat domain-containing protein [Candidatus Angelobacter sp.]|nr:HEAT repeat domain-containing protein [Candidatus Angelobacter sp.]
MANTPAQTPGNPVEQPAKISAVISTDWNGTQFYFPPLRNPVQTLVLFGFTAAWTGIVYLLFMRKSPLLFSIAFGTADVLLFLALVHQLFLSMCIRVTGTELSLKKSFFGFPRIQSIPRSEIARILPASNSRQKAGGDSFCSLRLIARDGREITLVDSIASQEARWLISKLETLVGLHQEPQGEVTDIYGLPPQNSATQATVRASSPAVAAFVLAWLVLVGCSISFVAFRGAYKRSRTSQQSTTASPVAPRTFAPLTTADTERIFSLPLQDQAEELLERSIRHDARALSLFQLHLSEWKGVVKETSRMTQLLNRAQYSRDLRVRYAYCDMMLAMDGWNRDSDAVNTLVTRAKTTDAKSRAYDLWFLGMLGGRGVANEQVHSLLLHYARTDPDPYVRQWAVEGMRFLGTDRALNDLFDIFVSDPSFNVRDRAGCNVSDCGNFMRKQRMAMFPKFLDLAENPSTNSQMRNWSFLAMQEITDAALPSNAASWRQWYRDHGAEKMAEFQKIPIWQVRGDE